VEFNVLHTLDVASRVRREKLGAVTVRHLGKTLLDALHIHAHGVNRACDQDRFRGHEVPCMGNTVP
jgi:hypothetical protein